MYAVIYTLSLHDAVPICGGSGVVVGGGVVDGGVDCGCGCGDVVGGG